jgi:Family of unknown function (DUF6516)
MAVTATDARLGPSVQVDGICVLRYDNEAGKGDHRHVSEKEEPYRFSDTDTLLADFWRDVEKWR